MIGSLSGVSPLGQNVQMSQHNPSPGERLTGNTATCERWYKPLVADITGDSNANIIGRGGHKTLRSWMFYPGQVGSGALQRRVRDESITAYLCCQVDDDRSFGLYLLTWKLNTKPEDGSRNVAQRVHSFDHRCRNMLNQTHLLDVWMVKVFVSSASLIWIKANCYMQYVQNSKKWFRDGCWILHTPHREIYQPPCVAGSSQSNNSCKKIHKIFLYSPSV